jgi:hypothetical protein
VAGSGRNALDELERLGYVPADTPRPGDVAMFVEDIPVEGGYTSNVRHAAIVGSVGPEMTFLSSNLTRASVDSQVTERPGQYSLAEMNAQDPALSRARIFYLTRDEDAPLAGPGPSRTSALPLGQAPVLLGPNGPARIAVDAEGVRLVNADGRPVSMAAARESVAGLLTDPRSPVLLTSALDPEAPPRTVASAANDFLESYYVVFYNPDTGGVRADQVASGEHTGFEADTGMIDDAARPGEIPIAGFHNHAPRGIAPSTGSEDQPLDRIMERRMFDFMQEEHGVEFRNFILRLDDGRPVLTDFGG